MVSFPKLAKRNAWGTRVSEQLLQSRERKLRRIQAALKSAKSRGDSAARRRLEHEFKDVSLVRDIDADWHRIGITYPYTLGEKQHLVSLADEVEIRRAIYRSLDMAVRKEMQLFVHRTFGSMGCVGTLRRLTAPLRLLFSGGVAGINWFAAWCGVKFAEAELRRERA